MNEILFCTTDKWNSFRSDNEIESRLILKKQTQTYKFKS